MTAPAFLNSSYRYLETPSVTDVATCISDFRSETVTNGSPAWTEPTANNFKSPPTSEGQFFTVVLNKMSTTRLGIKILDIFGQTICDRAIDIDAAGNTVRYFTGQCHAWIETARATPEVGGGALVDLNPDSVGFALYRTIGWGTRDTSGSVNTAVCSNWYMWDNAAAALTCRVNTIAPTSYCPSRALSGAAVFCPVLVTTQVYGANSRWMGRVFQMLLCPDDLGFGAEADVPIDTGTTGTFKVIARVTEANGKWRVAVRRT
jgi:hypothetical protein